MKSQMSAENKSGQLQVRLLLGCVCALALCVVYLFNEVHSVSHGVSKQAHLRAVQVNPLVRAEDAPVTQQEIGDLESGTRKVSADVTVNHNWITFSYRTGPMNAVTDNHWRPLLSTGNHIPKSPNQRLALITYSVTGRCPRRDGASHLVTNLRIFKDNQRLTYNGVTDFGGSLVDNAMWWAVANTEEMYFAPNAQYRVEVWYRTPCPGAIIYGIHNGHWTDTRLYVWN